MLFHYFYIIWHIYLPLSKKCSILYNINSIKRIDSRIQAYKKSETSANSRKFHLERTSEMLRTTMKQMEETLQTYATIVCRHRAFIVNLGQVEKISSMAQAMQLVMQHCHDTIPVSRSNISKLKKLLEPHISIQTLCEWQHMYP